ncbi:MAG: hypothetical protein HY331_08900 [Chloroflexi bacterium]|nr:hypothetical protein [Chloroflexota bacterium]
MMWLKACPRCHGDLAKQTDELGETFVGCLQCGYVRYLPVTVAKPVAARRHPPIKRRAA